MSLVYFALWVIFNGRITAEIVIAGIFLSFMLDVFVKRFMQIHFTGATFMKFLKLFPYAVIYVIVLLTETVKANFSLAGLLLAQDVDIEPCLVKFRTPLKSSAAKIALANSLTLAAGGVTVSVKGDEFLVHTLNRNTAGGLEGSVFERLLARMEGAVNA